MRTKVYSKISAHILVLMYTSRCVQHECLFAYVTLCSCVHVSACIHMFAYHIIAWLACTSAHKFRANFKVNSKYVTFSFSWSELLSELHHGVISLHKFSIIPCKTSMWLGNTADLDRKQEKEEIMFHDG